VSQEKAWELICRKAFQSEFQRSCPRELVRLSLDIVRKCEGLPLAIVAIGGLLSMKDKVPSEWQKFYDGLSSELESIPTLQVLQKFSLSVITIYLTTSSLASCTLVFFRRTIQLLIQDCFGYG
jgi:disease resistance protein RPM1